MVTVSSEEVHSADHLSQHDGNMRLPTVEPMSYALIDDYEPNEYHHYVRRRTPRVVRRGHRVDGDALTGPGLPDQAVSRGCARDARSSERSTAGRDLSGLTGDRDRPVSASRGDASLVRSGGSHASWWSSL